MGTGRTMSDEGWDRPSLDRLGALAGITEPQRWTCTRDELIEALREIYSTGPARDLLGAQADKILSHLTPLPAPGESPTWLEDLTAASLSAMKAKYEPAEPPRPTPVPSAAGSAGGTGGTAGTEGQLADLRGLLAERDRWIEALKQPGMVAVGREDLRWALKYMSVDGAHTRTIKDRLTDAVRGALPGAEPATRAAESHRTDAESAGAASLDPGERTGGYRDARADP